MERYPLAVGSSFGGGDRRGDVITHPVQPGFEVAMPTVPTPAKVAKHLSAADPRLKTIIHRVGVGPLPKDRGGFSNLAQAIVRQQISGAAGDAITRRLERARGGPGFPPASWFLSSTLDELRGAGLSPQKARYMVDLARHVESGALDFRRLRTAPDEEVIESLTAVHGIGRWTAQMYLIFSLNRPDVLPVSDLGIRKAVGAGWGYKRLPAESTVARHGRRWAPFRSHASIYLWRSLDAPPPGAV